MSHHTLKHHISSYQADITHYQAKATEGGLFGAAADTEVTTTSWNDVSRIVDAQESRISDYDEESSIETDYEEEEQDEEQQEMPETNFRLQAKKVFLTLSRVPNSMTHEDIKDRYVDTSVFQYIIAREVHSVETDSSAEEDAETDEEDDEEFYAETDEEDDEEFYAAQDYIYICHMPV